jgi:hypothetical protein
VETILLREELPLLIGDLSFMRLVTLVPHKRDDQLWISIRASLLQPIGDVYEAIPTRYVVDEQRASRTSVVAPHNRTEAILPSSVPALQLDGLVAYLHIPGTKFHSDSHLVRSSVPFVGELKQEARLAHSLVTNDNEFEQESVCRRIPGVAGGRHADRGIANRPRCGVV